MLLLLSAAKLIAEIALLALLGQWVLGLLAGQRKGQNIFYQILEQVGRPFVLAARLVTPRKIVLERHLPLVAFLLLAFFWLIVTALRIGHCLRIGVELCK
ncbi:MAG: hypothetical protein AB7S86_02915 [Hydrogenophaga sp.]|uniref:hypothetical protein n=1 Tax=Hydrogenophaga sp. TaxID=1904254 RepID=UPI003D1252AA